MVKYTREQRLRAVRLYERYDRSAASVVNELGYPSVLLQCLFSRLISIFPQCGRMVFPGLVIMQSVM